MCQRPIGRDLGIGRETVFPTRDIAVCTATGGDRIRSPRGEKDVILRRADQCVAAEPATKADGAQSERRGVDVYRRGTVCEDDSRFHPAEAERIAALNDLRIVQGDVACRSEIANGIVARATIHGDPCHHHRDKGVIASSADDRGGRSIAGQEIGLGRSDQGVNVTGEIDEARRQPATKIDHDIADILCLAIKPVAQGQNAIFHGVFANGYTVVGQRAAANRDRTDMNIAHPPDRAGRAAKRQDNLVGIVAAALALDPVDIGKARRDALRRAIGKAHRKASACSIGAEGRQDEPAAERIGRLDAGSFRVEIVRYGGDGTTIAIDGVADLEVKVSGNAEKRVAAWKDPNVGGVDIGLRVEIAQ